MNINTLLPLLQALESDRVERKEVLTSSSKDEICKANPGGLFGQVTPENFGHTTDYRNPQIAEALKTQGYVQRFGMGIQLARNALAKNGNPEPEFQFFPEYLNVTLRSAK